MKHLSLFAMLMLVFTAASASAATELRHASVWADGRFALHSPTYYTSYTADFAVSLGADLPWGSKVRLRAGLGGVENDWSEGGHEATLEWREISEVEALPVAPYTWTASFTRTLHERSWSRFYSKLQFVFVIDLPSGETVFERGTASVWGFHEAELPLPGQISSGEEPTFRRLSTYTVSRD